MRHHFKNLKVWQVGMDLVILVYKLTSKFPNDEKYSLITQINRSAVSVPSNIAQGSGRGTD
jgi:four helix bundle protein